VEWAKEIIEQYGYWAVFIGSFSEGEAVLAAAGALAAAGFLDPWAVIVTAALGAYAGHLFFFAVGRWRGIQIINAIPFLRSHYPKANKVLDHYAHWSVFIFQYLYGTRLVAAIMFGCSTITFPRFALLQVINCITWSFVVYGFGHLVGIGIMRIFDRFGSGGLWVAGAMVGTLVLIGYLLLRRFMTRRREKLATEPLE